MLIIPGHTALYLEMNFKDYRKSIPQSRGCKVLAKNVTKPIFLCTDLKFILTERCEFYIKFKSEGISIYAEHVILHLSIFTALENAALHQTSHHIHHRNTPHYSRKATTHSYLKSMLRNHPIAVTRNAKLRHDRIAVTRNATRSLHCCNT